MTVAASRRSRHGAPARVGGGLADWLIGAGVLALLVAALGFWGLPLLFPAERAGHATPGAGTAAVGLVDEVPLPTLPAIEAPRPPGPLPQPSAAAAPATGRAGEALRPEVLEILAGAGDSPAIEAARADAFVDAGQAIALPALPAVERLSVSALAQRLGNDPEAEVTVRREVVAVQPRRLVDLLQRALLTGAAAHPGEPLPLGRIANDLQQAAAPSGDPAALAHLGRLMSEAGIDPQARFTVDLGEGPRELPLVELLGLGALSGPEATIDVMERSELLERVTLATLLGGEGGAGEVEVLGPGPAAGRITTVAELLGSAAGPPDTIYYVRTVRPGDDQGVWGIVQQGVTETFARGVRLGEGGAGEAVTLAIPADADELEGRRSSFLGRLLARKVDASWTYNLDNGRMGRNPHLVYPGQELVIVGFAPADLNAIHDYFSSGGE